MKFVEEENPTNKTYIGNSRGTNGNQVKLIENNNKNTMQQPFPLKIDQKKLTSATKLARQALSEALGATKYHRAAYDGYLDLLCASSKRDANTPTLQQGLTPTLIAAQNGHIEALRMLVGRGGDSERCDSSGSTCLHLAAAQNHLNCVSFLVNFGVNMWSLDNEWHTAKDVAAICQRKEVLDYLDRMMARQSAINTKKVQKLKEKAKKSAEKRLKQLRKSQLKLIKQNERDERQLLKIASSRPMLKGALSISDIRLVGKPLIKYCPNYGTRCASPGLRLKAGNSQSITSLTNETKPTIAALTSRTINSQSSSDISQLQNQPNYHGKAQLKVSNCIKSFELVASEVAKRNLIDAIDKNNNYKHRDKQSPFEYDSGVSGGSSVSVLSSKPSLSSSSQSTSITKTGSKTTHAASISSNSLSSNTKNRVSRLALDDTKIDYPRPRYSDLVAIKPDYVNSTSPSDASRSSSLIERAKKSRALSGATKLKLRRLLRVVPQKTTSSYNETNMPSPIDATSAITTTKPDCSVLSTVGSERKIKMIKDSCHHNPKKDQYINKCQLHKRAPATSNKYHASMVDLTSSDGGTSHRSSHLDELSMKPVIVHNHQKHQTNDDCNYHRTDNNLNMNVNQSRAHKGIKLLPPVANTNCLDNNNNNCLSDETFLEDFKHHQAKSENLTIKWPLAPPLSRAFSQPDFGIKLISSDDAYLEKLRGSPNSDLSERKFDGDLAFTDCGLSLNVDDNCDDGEVSENHVIANPSEQPDKMKESNLKQQHQQPGRHISNLGNNIGNAKKKQADIFPSNTNKVNQEDQHHMMLNECLSQLKLHRKHQQLQLPTTQTINNDVNNKLLISQSGYPLSQASSVSGLNRNTGCTSSTELLQHQRQAGELPLKPSLIKQHQMAVSKMALMFNKTKQHQTSGEMYAKVADSIGSASSLVHRSNESSSVVSSSTRSAISDASHWSTSKNSQSSQKSRFEEREMQNRERADWQEGNYQRKRIINNNLAFGDEVDAEPTVEMFLNQNGLNDLREIFAREMIDFEALLLLSETDLKSINILLGPRRKLLKAIENYKLNKTEIVKGTAETNVGASQISAPLPPPPFPPPPPLIQQANGSKMSMVATKL